MAAFSLGNQGTHIEQEAGGKGPGGLHVNLSLRSFKSGSGRRKVCWIHAMAGRRARVQNEAPCRVRSDRCGCTQTMTKMAGFLAFVHSGKPPSIERHCKISSSISNQPGKWNFHLLPYLYYSEGRGKKKNLPCFVLWLLTFIPRSSLHLRHCKEKIFWLNKDYPIRSLKGVFENKVWEEKFIYF